MENLSKWLNYNVISQVLNIVLDSLDYSTKYQENYVTQCLLPTVLPAIRYDNLTFQIVFSHSNTPQYRSVGIRPAGINLLKSFCFWQDFKIVINIWANYTTWFNKTKLIFPSGKFYRLRTYIKIILHIGLI